MSGQGIAQFIPLILIFVIFYFFLIRPQQKRVKDHKAMVEALKRGDEIITSGGIIGIVERVMEDDRIEVDNGNDTKVQIIKSTITSLLKKRRNKKIILFRVKFFKNKYFINLFNFFFYFIFSILNFQSKDNLYIEKS